MKLIFVCCLPVLLFILFSSCDTNEPLPQGAIGLTLEDVSCTEAWITLTIGNLPGTAYIKITNNGNLIETIDVTATKTLLYYDTLQPNTNYEFQAFSSQRGEDVIGNKLQITTLDTTSHNFTWQTFTFGDPEAGSSVFNDVAIINENSIWVVGEIYLNDSTGQPDPLPYNIAHWNGLEWKFQKLTYQGYPPAISSIFAINENDIWFDPWFHWDGQSFQEISIDPILIGVGVNKMWVNENGIYVIGNGGFIAQRSNNGSWQRIESGTTTNVNDVWGINDSAANNSLVLCTVSNRYELGDHKLLSISGNMATEYFTWPYTRLYSIWFNSPREIYIVRAGAYVYKNNILKTINLPTNYFLTGVKGNALNDIYISSSDAVIFHYNGINWMEMSNGIYGKYEGMDVKGNTEVFVGYNIEGGMVGKAIVTIGRRN